jgi:hypothetical protein
LNCRICEQPLLKENFTKKQWQYKKDMFRIKGYVFCSRNCSSVYCKKISSETMSKTNKIYASERMKNNNPTFKPEVRAKISESRKGHVPTVRRGNGVGLTAPQELLLNALSDYHPIPEYAIKTLKPKGGEYPTCYKPDIAILSHMIAIDIDGASHHSHARRAEDIKKDALLSSLGWKVIRFWNSEVLQDLDSCIQAVRRLVA